MINNINNEVTTFIKLTLVVFVTGIITTPFLQQEAYNNCNCMRVGFTSTYAIYLISAYYHSSFLGVRGLWCFNATFNNISVISR